MKSITVYSHETCPWCKKLKAHLDEKGVSYTDFDVMKDESKAKELEELTHQYAVPVSVIGDGEDQEIIIGFDPEKIDAVLGL